MNRRTFLTVVATAIPVLLIAYACSTRAAAPNGPGSGTSSVQGGGSESFDISGDVGGLFLPGTSRPVDLVFTNPAASPITVESVTVTVDPVTSRAGCHGRANLTVVQHLTGPVTVPAGSTASLSGLGVPHARWPVMRMPDLATNQDACKDARFRLHYAGRAAG